MKEKNEGKSLCTKGSENDREKTMTDKIETVEKDRDATTKPVKVFCFMESRLGTMNGKNSEQLNSQLKSNAKEEYPAQLNIKFNKNIGYDNNMTTPASKLPDNAPTFILVGDRF